MFEIICTQAAFGVTVNGSKLFISDWYNGTISMYDTQTDSLEVIVSDGIGQPACLSFNVLSLVDSNGNLCHTLRRSFQI